MMDVKLLEIRDRATFIPVIAIRLVLNASGELPQRAAERYLLRRAGYGGAQIIGIGEPYVVLCKLDGCEARCDPHEWPNQRTMGTAHRHIIEQWDDLESGDVIDVEFIEGETRTKKTSEHGHQDYLASPLDPRD